MGLCFLKVLGINVDSSRLRRLILDQKLLFGMGCILLIVRSSRVQPGKCCGRSSIEGKVKVLIIIKINFFYFDNEEVTNNISISEGNITI
jgi:hypothetical protein